MKLTKTIFVLAWMAASATSVLAIKIVHGPYLQNVYENEATIVWISDKPSVGWVELAPDDGTTFYATRRAQFFDTEIGVKRTSNLHAVRLTGLKAGTNYRYRIYSKEVLSHKGFRVMYGDVAATDVYRKQPLKFRTLDSKKSETNFVMINDIHARKDIIAPMLNAADYKNRDLIFLNGDMISIVNEEKDFFDGFLDECINLFAKEQCMYYVRGNHETRGEFATEFNKYVCPRQSHLYFTMRQGPVYFINLDTGEDKPDDDIEYSGITDYDNYRSEQAEWLKTVKDDPLFQSAKYRIVIAHMPMSHEPGEWHGPRDCADKFFPILNTMGIDVMLCGHLHRDKYYEPSGEANFPIIVNSNNGTLEGETHGNELTLQVRHTDGKVVTKKVYKAKR